MTDRLQQIWKSFESRTTLDLSGTSIDQTPRPQRAEAQEQRVTLDAPIRTAHKDEHGIDAVNAALTAMHTQMAEAANSRRPRSEQDLAAFRTMPETDIDKTLFADVSYTRSKTDRGGSDYISYAAGRQLNWQSRKKKWFFGLF